MILLYAEKQDMGIRYAASLGGINLNGELITTDKINDNQKELKALANKNGFLMTDFEGQKICTTWGWGHFGTLKGIKDYDPALVSWKDIPLPFIPKKFEVKRIENESEYFKKRDDRQFEIIKKLFNSEKIEYIVNATDWEREGELIFAYVYDLTGSTKPYYRMRCNSKTDAQIHKDFKKLVDAKENEPFVLAARARSIADWIVGINMTISASINLSPDGKMLNVGRVLTPTLALIVNRENEILNFSSKTTYGLTCEFTTKDGTYKGKLEDEDFVFTDEEKAKEAAKKFESEGVIKSIKRETKKINPPLLYDTKGLQVDANDIYGFTLEETLSLAQKLYENGYITYPRVDSCYMTEDKKKEAPDLVKILGKHPRYKTFVTASPKIPNRYFKAVDAHDAIIPTEVMPTKLTENEAKIYDLVVRRFLMSSMEAAEKEKVTIITEVSGKEFKTTGTLTTSSGFEQALVKNKKDAEIPTSIKDGLKVNASVSHNETTTKPPARYTDASLIKAMETCGRKIEDEELKGYLNKSKGIGRPSTRASIMERLVKIGYVERKRKTIYPTEKGMKAIASLPVEELKSPILTAKWEERLDEIEHATISDAKTQTVSYIKDISAETTKWCNEIKANRVKKKAYGSQTDLVCPNCGGTLYRGKFSYNCSCGFIIPFIIGKRKFKKTEIRELLSKGETKMLTGFKSNAGKDFSAKFVLEEGYRCTNKDCNALQSQHEKCFKCGSPTEKEEGSKVMVMRFKEK